MRSACLVPALVAAVVSLAAAHAHSAPRLRSVEAQVSVSGCAISVTEAYAFSSWPGSGRFARDLPYAADRLSAVAIAFPGANEATARSRVSVWRLLEDAVRAVAFQLRLQSGIALLRSLSAPALV